jgi:hypothetical protein
MSSDLLKEFGDLDENPWASDRPAQEDKVAEDDFGDFEEPEPEATGIDVPYSTKQTASHATQKASEDLSQVLLPCV